MHLRLPRMILWTSMLICTSSALAACGGNQSQQSTQPVATTAAMAEQRALPLERAAPIPRGLHCRDGVVWANMHTKAYHLSADPYYGRTRNGEYLCLADAQAKGFHAAGTRHKGLNGSMQGGESNPVPRRHRSTKYGATPEPTYT